MAKQNCDVGLDLQKTTRYDAESWRWCLDSPENVILHHVFIKS